MVTVLLELENCMTHHMFMFAILFSFFISLACVFLSWGEVVGHGLPFLGWRKMCLLVFVFCFVLCKKKKRRSRDESRHHGKGRTDEISVLSLLSSYLR